MILSELREQHIEGLCAATAARRKFGPEVRPVEDEVWPAAWTLEASTIADALLQLDAREITGPLQVLHCRVVGPFELPETEFSRSLSFEECHFDSDVIVAGATVRTLAFVECELPILHAPQVRVTRNCNLMGLRAEQVNLGGARIDGQLALRSAELRPGERFPGMALIADWIDVRGGMFCDHGFRAFGHVRLPFARIGAQLGFDNARVELDLGEAVSADGAEVAGTVSFNSGYFTGEVRLIRAKIGGELDFQGASLGATEGTSLSADNARVDGNCLLSERFSTVGEVRLSGAEISGELVLAGAHIRNQGRVALAAEAMTVRDDAHFDSGLQIEGETRLTGSSFGGQLLFDGASLDAAGASHALVAESLVVRDMLSLSGAEIRGAASLSGTSVEHEMTLDAAKLADCVITAERARIGTLHMDDWADPPRAIGLGYAHVALLVDDPARWPSARNLDGLEYERLGGRTAVETRLSWIEQDMDGFEPQVFDELAAYYGRSGREEDARVVAIAKQKRRRTELRWPARVWSWFLQVTIGFGYRTHRAVVWLGVLFLLGWAVLAGAAFLDPPELRPTRATGVPPFQPAAYALDVLLPVVDFGQERAYALTGPARWLSWGSTLAGWVLSTAIAASLARRFNRP